MHDLPQHNTSEQLDELRREEANEDNERRLSDILRSERLRSPYRSAYDEYEYDERRALGFNAY